MHPTKLAMALVLALAGCSARAQDEATMIEEALRAAPAALAEHAAVMDWEINVLREGTNGFTCFPTPAALEGNSPLCLDAPWMSWAGAWMNKTDVEISTVGIGYMLAGDGGASNSDPYAEDAAAVDDWVVTGPHLMVIVPNAAALENVTTDYTRGVPWVMWKGTPYAHIMVPLTNPGQ